MGAFIKARIGSIKTLEQIEIWKDLPSSKVDKILKSDLRERLSPGS